MREIELALSEVEVGQPVTARNLTMFPLIAARSTEPAYTVLPEALSRGTARVSETGSAGTVPELKLVNEGPLPVLLLDGEELLGCKQHRILNLTILAPAKKELLIPVSCVERGRWHDTTEFFAASKHSLYAGLRARKTAHVSRNLAAAGMRSAAQSEIWEDIALKSERLGSQSSTGAMEGIFKQREADIRAYRGAGRTVEHQVGAVFAINGRIVGLELFDAEKTCAGYLEKIASGYALDAIDYYTPLHPVASREDAGRFLERVAREPEERFPSIGIGEDVRINGGRLTGAALVAQGRTVHLCAFDWAIAGENRPNEVRRGTAVRAIRRSRRAFAPE
jgi:hypothetical protein